MEFRPMEFHPAANLFPMMGQAEYLELVYDLRVNGQVEPIVTYQGQILDGRNRYKAMTEIGRPPILREWDGLGNPIAYVISLNLRRRHLDESQRAMVAARVADMRAGRPSETAPIGAVSQAAASDMLNVGRRSTQRASEVIEHGAAGLVAEVDAGNVAVSAAAVVARLPEDEQEEIVARGPQEIIAKAKELRQARRDQKKADRTEMHEALAAGNRELDFGEQRFPVVEADPPWEFNNKGVNGAAEVHYPTLSVDAICALPVERHLTPEAICYLWVPNALLPDGLRVLAAWGFVYKTSEAWDKGDDNNGTGFYDHQNHETLLIGVRGGNMTPVVRFSSLLRAPATDAHSEKPDELYERIDAMYPGAPKLGLFWRNRQRDGWTPWGNQAAEAIAPAKHPPCAYVFKAGQHGMTEDAPCHHPGTVTLVDGRHVCEGCACTVFRKVERKAS